MNDTLVHEGFEPRCQKVLQVAKELYHGNPDWVTFFREVLGVNGAARSVFQNQNDYVTFEKSSQYSEIQQMVANLRTRKIPGGGHNEATRVITVRLPESLHEALKAEASDHNTSMNKLCISKLLQVLMEEQNSRSAPIRTTAPTQAPQPAAPRQNLVPQTPSIVRPISPLPAANPIPAANPLQTNGPMPSNPAPQGDQPRIRNY